MTDGPPDLGEVSYVRLFPWLRLVRAVGSSFEPRRLVLAALGLAVLDAGWSGLADVFPGSPGVAAPRPFNVPIRWETWGEQASGAASIVADPARTLVAPFLSIFDVGRGAFGFLHAFLAVVWAVTVWAIFGGAIARIAAVRAATDEPVTMWAGLRFALAKRQPLIVAPLGPFLGVFPFAAICGLLGLLYRIPGPFGVTLAGALAFVPLALGALMALILGCAAIGWPLMIAAIAVEAEDSFDAMSRGFGYVHQRSGRLLGYVAFAWVLGTFGMALTGFLASLTLQLALWGLGLGAPDQRLLASFQGHPGTDGGPHGFWSAVLAHLAHGWAYSYFWTATTHIYMLVRRDVDGTPYHDVADGPR